MPAYSWDEEPYEAAYQGAMYFRRSEIMGKTFMLRFLKSEQGRKLNGQRCNVVGVDDDPFEGRYHARLSNGRVVKVKQRNLASPESAVIHQMGEYAEEDLLEAVELLPLIEKVLIWAAEEPNTRADFHHRIAVMKRYREHLLDNNPALKENSKEEPVFNFVRGDHEDRMTASSIPCGDDRFFDKNDHSLTDSGQAFAMMMRAARPACSGDGSVDFQRFAFGLSGGSYLPECSICLEDILKEERNVIKLSCQHVFHDRCISHWVEKLNHTECPTCRQEMLAKNMQNAYRLKYESHIQTRLQEFIMSGMCVKCQSFILERDPFYYQAIDGGGNVLVNDRGEQLFNPKVFNIGNVGNSGPAQGTPLTSQEPTRTHTTHK